MVASTLAWLALTVTSAATPIAPLQWGNELTLPAQRHLVRMAPPGFAPYLLLSAQRDGLSGVGLTFFRSDDEGASWSLDASIQNDWTERDEADLLPVADDLALVYSYEGPNLVGSARHDVWFQWWRNDPASGRLRPQAPVLVFDSTSTATAYSRAELALDSAGRIWVLAFRLETSGASTVVVSVSNDGGASFAEQPALDTLPARGGGRILSLGGKLFAVYGIHGIAPARFRVRDDAAPVSQWQPSAQAFPEGIYHGAAMSAVADLAGGAHVFYKADDERLYYRHFDGASFGPSQLLVASGDWALQPATTRIGSQVVVFYNVPLSLNANYSFRARVLTGGSFSPEITVDGSTTFKCYPGAAEELPSTTDRVPVAYASQPGDGIDGNLVASLLRWPAVGAPPPSPQPPPPPPPSPPPPTPPPPPPGSGPTAIIVLDHTPASGPAPLLEQFDATTSLCPGTWCAAFLWDFGDGTPRSSAGWLMHTYAANGTYVAKLTVTDGAGQTSTATKTITVGNVASPPPSPPPPPPPPPPGSGPTAIIVLDHTPASGPAPLLEQLDATFSTCPGTWCAAFEWDFGDGSPRSSAGWIIHTYAAKGTYVAKLTVTDGAGLKSTATRTITVGP